MPEMSENDVNRKMLVDAEAALKGKTERMLNIKASVTALKKKMTECMDKSLWDQAQDVLNQTHKLSVDAEAADADVAAAQARVDGLQMAIVRVEAKLKKEAEQRGVYVPYAPEATKVESAKAANAAPVLVEPVQESQQ